MGTSNIQTPGAPVDVELDAASPCVVAANRSSEVAPSTPLAERVAASSTSVPIPGGHATTPTDLFPCLSIAELRRRPRPKALIKGVLSQGTMAGLIGASGAGKSFLALDFALCVATGHPWNGRPVLRGPAFYVAAEAPYTMRPRIDAWERSFGPLAEAPFRLIEQPTMVSDPNVAQKVVASIIAAGVGDPTIVVFDTLAACYEGDENDASDMERFVRGVRAVISAFRGSTALVVHHVGKDQEKGARGSSALKAALDTELTLRIKKGAPVLHCTKQRNAAPFDPIGLCHERVDIGEDEPSAVMKQKAYGGAGIVEEPAGEAAKPSIKKSDRSALEVLQMAGSLGLSHGAWRTQSGLTDSTFNRARERLLDAGLVRQDSEGRYHSLDFQLDLPAVAA